MMFLAMVTLVVVAVLVSCVRNARRAEVEAQRSLQGLRRNRKVFANARLAARVRQAA